MLFTMWLTEVPRAYTRVTTLLFGNDASNDDVLMQGNIVQ